MRRHATLLFFTVIALAAVLFCIFAHATPPRQPAPVSYCEHTNVLGMTLGFRPCAMDEDGANT